MLLDELMPDYDFREAHVTYVDASPQTLMHMIKTLRPDDLWLFTVLFSFRNLPARLVSHTAPAWSSERPLLDQLLARGFVLLAEDPDRGIVVGTLGRFWTLNAWTPGAAVPSVPDVRDFLDFRSGALSGAVSGGDRAGRPTALRR